MENLVLDDFTRASSQGRSPKEIAPPMATSNPNFLFYLFFMLLLRFFAYY